MSNLDKKMSPKNKDIKKLSPRNKSRQYISQYSARDHYSEIKSTKSGRTDASRWRVYRDPRDNCLKYGHAPPDFENMS